jgi:hypothetical protein
MRAARQKERSDDRMLRDRQKQQASIRQQVLCSLGEPADFREMVVRQLWEDFCRLNVFVGENAATGNI